MYFKRIEMQGFKSFADPVSIELNDGVTCIIGPNGSGKSNISDALRWVLGEQSSKQLRGSKMQDVIFAGTETRKPRGMAEVSLVIDNSAGLLPLEYSEVVVTRRMYRSGESEYLINGNNCRLKDIRELFMDTGIGVDGYSIIGQGRIADIVSTKPENRRQIFEEAAGVVLYKSRKTEAENKLKSATDNLERVRDIIAEIEGRIGGLKEDSEKASEYIVLRDRYRTLGINIILHNLESLVKSVESGKSELDNFISRIEEANEKSRELEEALEKFRLEDAAYNEAYSKANEELILKIDELNTITSGGQLNIERLNNIEKELERLNCEIDEAEAKLENENVQLNDLIRADKELSDSLSQAREEYEKAVVAYNEHVSASSDIDRRIEESKERIIEINNKNVSRNAEINTLNNYKKTLVERRESIIAEHDGRDARDAENRNRLNELEEAVKKAEKSLEESRTKVYAYSDNILSVNKEITDTGNSLDELVVMINRAIARRNTIEEMEHNYEGYNNAVRMLMQKSMGGIIGTVSDLIEVPAGYETAIETALGNNLQNIVCKDDASAKSAINWLKSAKAGRATFLPVESIHADRLILDRNVENAEGFIGIASEMVKAESRFSEIVDYLLCRVIVADNMDNAVRLSKLNVGGFRIVTLDGEVINSYGAITGGKFANRTANLLDRKKEIAELSNRIAELEKKSDELKKTRDEKRIEVEKLIEDRNKLNADIQQSEIEFNVLKADRDHALELVGNDSDAADRHAEEIRTIASDIESAEKMISRYETEIEDSKADAKLLESDVEKLMNDNNYINLRYVQQTEKEAATEKAAK